MSKKIKTIFNYFILILLGAALIACGKLVHSQRSARQEQEAKKLAAAKANLNKSATSSSRKRYTSRNTRRTSTRRTTKTGST